MFSWVSSSFLLIFAVIVTGCFWYERQRPSSKTVAVVATMAALAALGRIAFAPIPNVKPTTDIVFMTGFALGGIPGFMTGAVAALTSNIFFGQGPWTPWQMVGWAGVGVVGGLVAMLYRGRVPSRLMIGLICAGLGLLFGIFMDFFTWTVMTTDHTLKKFWAISVTSLPFNLAHAAGNFVFGVAFGPTMAKALKRFKARTTIKWRENSRPSLPAGVALFAVLLIVPALALFTAGPSSAEGSAEDSVDYLTSVQGRDGGFGSSKNSGSSMLYTGWAALGIAAAGVNPADVSRNGKTPLDYIKKNAKQLTDLAEIERTVLVLVASGRNPKKFAGKNFIAAIEREVQADGSIGGLVNTTAFGVMALRGSGVKVSDQRIINAGRWLAEQQNDDGGFNFAKKGTGSDIDMTAAAVQGLVSAGRGNTQAVENALEFLKVNQNNDGGFPLNPGDKSNAQSTAWAVQAVSASGVDGTENLRSRIRTSGLSYLEGLIEDNGRVRYSPSSGQTPVWVTAQVIPALEGKPFPIAAVPRKVKEPTTRTNTDTSDTYYEDYTPTTGFDGGDTFDDGFGGILDGDDGTPGTDEGSSSGSSGGTSSSDSAEGDSFVDPSDILGPPTPLTRDPKVAEQVRQAGYVTSLLFDPLT